MKNITIICTVLFPFFSNTIFSQSCASSANIYSFIYGGKNYEVVKELKTWTQAAACAVTRGGHLVHIDSAGEQNAVYNAITIGAGVASNYVSVGDGGGAAYVWIGATDKNIEGTWLWDGDGDNLGVNFYTGQGAAGAGTGAVVGGAYANWGGAGAGSFNEPDNYLNLQDGGAMALSSWPYGVPGEWNDINPTNSIYYVIEYESGAGIHEHGSNSFHLDFFPDPAKNILTFSFSEEMKYSYNMKMYSEDGKLVSDKEMLASQNFTDISSLLPGIYFMLIEGKDNLYYRGKFVKE